VAVEFRRARRQMRAVMENQPDVGADPDYPM
jgi:hypothetical protein